MGRQAARARDSGGKIGEKSGRKPAAGGMTDEKGRIPGKKVTAAGAKDPGEPDRSGGCR